MEFEEVRYGMVMMVLCDRWGRVYDVWISFGSMHEVRLSACCWFWHIKEWKGIFKVF